MSHRRVVITGMGAVTPLGNDLASTWDGIVNGRSGIGPVTQFDTTTLIAPGWVATVDDESNLIMERL